MNGGLVERITPNEGGAKGMCYKLKPARRRKIVPHIELALQNFAFRDKSGKRQFEALKPFH
jgi:hypothetical protein